MSYMKDLDEINLTDLVNEVRRRAVLVRDGKCTYCEQPTDTEPCKMTAMHNADATSVTKIYFRVLGRDLLREFQ